MAESQRGASLLTVHGRVLWELLPNLMSIRRRIRETVKTVPVSLTERTPKMQRPSETTGSFPSVFAVRSPALRILHVLAHLMLTTTAWWHKH